MDRYGASARDLGSNDDRRSTRRGDTTTRRDDTTTRRGDTNRDRETSRRETTRRDTTRRDTTRRDTTRHDTTRRDTTRLGVRDNGESNSLVKYDRPSQRGTTNEPSTRHHPSADGGRGSKSRRSDMGSELEHGERDSRVSRRGTALSLFRRSEAEPGERDSRASRRGTVSSLFRRSEAEPGERDSRVSRRGTVSRRSDYPSNDQSRSGGRSSMAPTGDDYDYGRGVHADHRDLLSDCNIINEDDFEDGLIQRGYVQDDMGRYHHPRHQAGRLASRDSFDD